MKMKMKYYSVYQQGADYNVYKSLIGVDMKYNHFLNMGRYEAFNTFQEAKRACISDILNDISELKSQLQVVRSLKKVDVEEV